LSPWFLSNSLSPNPLNPLASLLLLSLSLPSRLSLLNRPMLLLLASPYTPLLASPFTLLLLLANKHTLLPPFNRHMVLLANSMLHLPQPRT
ncbi:hypothetical protein BGZ46_001077, partial [Entomortierella lignicola]